MLHYHLTLAHSFAKDRFIKYRSTNLLLAYIPQNLQVHILDGRIPHCLLLEIFTNKGIGTAIKNDIEERYYYGE